MKKARIESVLDFNNGIEQVFLNNGRDSISSEDLLNLLRDGVKTRELRNGRKIKNDRKTKYIFDINSYDTEKEINSQGLLVVTIDNSKIQYLYKTISSIEDICTISAQIKKINKARVIAGILVSFTILTANSPTIARGLVEYIKGSYEYDARMSIHAYEEYKLHRQPTDEEVKETESNYYKDLEERAKNGDEAAIKEYSEYLIEQLNEQFESKTKTK